MSHHTPRTHYEVLGVEPYADISEIKSAYKAGALKTHPDKNGGTPKAKEAFQHLVNAYEVLSDVTKRKSYDQTLRPAYYFPSWSTQPESDQSPFFCAPTRPTRRPPSSNPSDWPLPSETFINGKPASWWRKYEEEERQREEKEQEQARKRAKGEEPRRKRDEQQKGKTHETKNKKPYGEFSRKQREQRKRGVEELVGEVMRIARELEKVERKRKEVWKGKDWDRGGGQSKM